MTQAMQWEHLPQRTRDLIEHQTGPVVKAEPVTAGRNHQLAAILHTTTAGALFLKGIHTSHQRSHRQALEAAVAATVATTSPRLLWHLPDAGGWNLLAFEALLGARHADLRPGARDLGRITQALQALGEAANPPRVVTDHIEQRWAEHAQANEAELLGGEHLLHTDLRPDNILISGTRAWIVDWSWPTRGAAWIDPACLTLWLIAHGFSPPDAQRWMRTVPTARDVPSAALDAFTRINARLWSRIAMDDPQPWKARLANAATEWTTYRTT
jgi:hypothetical protein